MKAKKQLGQNFLNSNTVAREVAEAAQVNEQDTVVEIGPGTGALTRVLLDRATKVIAVEKDPELIPRLKAQFAPGTESKKLELIEGDILDEKLLNTLPVEHEKYKVVANIPYYITGQILRTFLSADIKPSSMTLMLQKEVAERIVARNGKESILSLSVKAYGTPKYIKKIPARYFSPKPKVDSAILHIENISSANFSSVEEEDLFFKLVKTGFAHKRKFLARNLEVLFGKEIIEKTFQTCELAERSRAEDVPLKKWLCITKSVS